MTKLVLRGLAARKVRSLLTALAVLLGVAMVSGSYVLTDTINASFARIFEQGTKGVAVEVTPHENVRKPESDPPPFREELLQAVREVDGVQTAVGGIFGQGSILGKDGKPISTQGAPNFIASVVPPQMSPFQFVAGRVPVRDGEVAFDKFTADRHKFRVGEMVGIAGRARARKFKVVGVARYGEVSSFGGASVAVVTLEDAQTITGNQGRLQSIEVAPAPGVSDQELKRRIRAALPASVDVRTGREQAAKQTSDFKENFSALTTVLLAFGFIALFVGGFIIFNTFSITVAQRTREFALLRTLGASRRQMLGAVVFEALLIGVVASAVGLVAGIGYAKGIGALFSAIGIDLPSQGTVLLTRTIVVAVLVGVVLTVLASLFPAIRATRVAPLEALRVGSGAQAGPRRWRYGIGAVLVAAGIAAMAIGLNVDDSDSALSLIGLGALLVFLGSAMLSPRLVPPLARLASAPLVRFRGLAGRLARENAMRNPGRTAVTAAALMIGVALVSFVAVFAAGLKAGINDTIDQSFRGDLVLQNTDGFSPISPGAADAVGGLPGVAAVTHWRFSVTQVAGTKGRSSVTGLDPSTGAQAFRLDWEQGSQATLRGLRPGQAIVDTKYAKKNDIAVGDTVRARTTTGAGVTLKIVGSVNDKADFLGDLVVPLSQIERDWDERDDALALVKLAPGTPVEPVKKRINALLARDFPTVDALNQKELKDRQEQQFDQLVGLIYAFLSLAVVVSIFGIVNTLVLTIHERTRELGLLRAVGMSRKQVRQLVRYESVVTALIGALLGTALGIFFALVVSRPIADEGFVLKFPVASIVAFLVLAAIAGVLAAIPPARRASRLDVLEALAYE